MQLHRDGVVRIYDVLFDYDVLLDTDAVRQVIQGRSFSASWAPMSFTTAGQVCG